MVEEKTFDADRFSKGTQFCSKFRGVVLPDDGGMSLNDLNLRSLYKNGFRVLSSWNHPRGDGKQLFSYLLQESHKFMVYDPKKGKLFDATYSCSPEKTGEKTFEELKKEIKTEPYFVEKTHPLVSKAKVSPEQFFKSVAEAFEKLKLSKDRDHYISCVFFDIPQKKMGEESWEAILTKALRAATIKPITETVHVFPGQGYTYMHQSNIFLALHSYPELESVHMSIFGTVDEIMPVLAEVESKIYSKSRTPLITVSRDAWVR